MVNYTSELQPQFHREKVTIKDQYGATYHLYVHATQSANRTALIQSRLTQAQELEDATTALKAQIEGTVTTASPAIASVASPAAAAIHPADSHFGGY